MSYIFRLDFNGYVELDDELEIYDVLSKLFQYAKSSRLKIESVRFALENEEEEEMEEEDEVEEREEEKIGVEEEIKEITTMEKPEKEEEIKAEKCTMLTEKVGYKIVNGDLVLKYDHPSFGMQTIYRADMQDIYAVYEELPEKSDKNTILQVMNRFGLKINPNYISHLMRFFAEYPVFSAELVKEKGRNYLIKKDAELKEMKDKLAVEREMIGTPWDVKEG